MPTAFPCLLLLALLAGAGPLVGAAGAQPEVTDVEAELERTDRILDRARDQIEVSLTGRARDFLSRAIEIQAHAWRSYREGGGSGRHQQALQLTQKARDLARRAVETAALEIRASEKIRDLIGSTRDLIDRTTEHVQESGDDQAARLLEAGVRQLQLAQEAYRGGELRHAIRLVGAARDLVQRARDRVRVRESSGASVEAMLERTEVALEEIALEVDGTADERTARRVEEARRLLDTAWQRHRGGQPRAALALGMQARRAVLEAMLGLTRTPERPGVDRALRAVGQLIEDLAPEISASGSSKAAELLDSARTRHREAVREADGGRLGPALERARLADRLLKRAAEAAGIR
ncbi:MAG: hypothetical protein GF346_13685 [Candidatus Eisenbacteria bacterium]|nr:hypothetical protein [Candidatus Latescibacterota bacterium]MBD3303492.1 hypothetical protein [Candidatus Eisenbacteria bacterium]